MTLYAHCTLLYMCFICSKVVGPWGGRTTFLKTADSTHRLEPEVLPRRVEKSLAPSLACALADRASQLRHVT